MNFDIKKFVNQVVVIPDDTKEWTKWGVALVIAVFAKYGMDLGEAETILVTGVVKGITDYVHFLLKQKGVI